ncbi:glycine betaine ABC transporter substrate-binding protein [Shewanella sp. 10N.286.51.B2]|uniref:glycine betaine ABC transporter substrate-binding protein n=1 Tax=Shewanella sp. 10N.286.51.B2 TaxID=3229707 RepID=UPI00354CF0AD
MGGHVISIFDAEVFTQLLKRNNKKHIPSLFFCYYPDQIFTMENVHRVNDVKHDSQTWEEIIYQKIPPPNAHGISWPKTEIHIGFRSDLLQDFQELETLLNSFTIKNDDLIALLALQNEGHSPEEAANIWLNNNRDTVLAWFTGFQLSSSKKADALGVN